MKKIELILQGGIAEATILETFQWRQYDFAITKRLVEVEDAQMNHSKKQLYEAVLVGSCRPMRNSFEKDFLKEATIASFDNAKHQDKLLEAIDNDIAHYPLLKEGIDWAKQQDPTILRGAVLVARDKGIFN